jgi:hypothetical protein
LCHAVSGRGRQCQCHHQKLDHTAIYHFNYLRFTYLTPHSSLLEKPFRLQN